MRCGYCSLSVLASEVKLGNVVVSGFLFSESLCSTGVTCVKQGICVIKISDACLQIVL